MAAAIEPGRAGGVALKARPLSLWSRLPTPLLHLGIVPNVLFVMALLACTAALIGWLGFDAIRTYGSHVARINNASDRAVLGEQINGLINAIVMDARGIYMSRSQAEVEKFAPPLLANLAVLEAKTARWASLMPPERLHELDAALAHLRNFAALRREIVRLGREEPAKARAFGDADVPRANRQALNREIVALAAANADEVDGLAADLEEYRAEALTWILVITVGGIALSLVFAGSIVVGTVTRPLARMTAAIRQLAAGDMSVVVPGLGRGDEIGTIANAVEVFRASMIEVERLRDRRHAETEADHMRGLANAAVEGLLICDGETIVTVNSSLATLMGAAAEQVVGADFRSLLPADAARAQLFERSDVAVETVLRHVDGTMIPVEAIRRPVDFVGKPHSAIAIRDLRDRKKAEGELRQARLFLNTVIDYVPTVLVVKDVPDFRYVLVNRAAEEFYGLARDEIIGKTAHEIYSKETADLVARNHAHALENRSSQFHAEHEIETPRNGQRRVIAKTLPILDDDGKAQHVLTVIEDVTERRRIEARVVHLAYHDGLTGLHNRSAFAEHLAPLLESRAISGEPFAVICVDLDRFKEINDVCGHAVGDAVLREAALRLQAAAEGAFLARIGGDEFMLIVADGPQPATAAAVADRLLAAVADDFQIAGHRLRVGLSIGIAIFPADGTDATVLVGNADAALYRAKKEGRGATHFFEHSLDSRLRERRAMLGDLRLATEREQIALHYQPQATMAGDVFGFEALARWHHPVRGLVPPDIFIPLAEETGLIVAMGEWILREACREAASWPRPLQVAVNLSPVQFRHGDLPDLVHSILLASGLPPDRLELEITEGVLIGDTARALSILRRLKSLGVRIAMDDFGTGYSSLSYLQSFPFDKIKIDKSFIVNLKDETPSAAIVRAIIGLGHGLDVPVIAEGVEIAEQLTFLKREGCSEAQGYLIGRPRSIEDYAEQTHGGSVVERRSLEVG